jgi:hypothetical protein
MGVWVKAAWALNDADNKTNLRISITRVTKNPSWQKIYIDRAGGLQKTQESLNYWDNSYIYHTNYCMRKSTSIILLLILLFNMIGYRALFYYAENKADASMQARLDKDQYDENELVALQIPIYNPYQIEQKTYERVNGEINMNGKIFRYVKRKVSDGNIILLCIADNHKMVLKKAKSDYGYTVNDLPANGKNSGRSGLQKNFKTGDYIKQCAGVRVCGCVSSNLKHAAFHLVDITDPHITLPGKPPEYRA